MTVPSSHGTSGDSARIYVCGLAEMPLLAARYRPQRLVSLLPEWDQPLTPAGIPPENHHRVPVDDIEWPGPTAPDRPRIEDLVAFLSRSPAEESLLIHCLMGISRSTAAALIALVADAPGAEFRAAATLRAAAPFADPNRLMIELADDVLDRDGDLIAALDSMGPGSDYASFEPITLPRGV